MSIVFLTDCLLATVEDWSIRQRHNKVEYGRHVAIAQIGVDTCNMEDIKSSPRLVEVYEQYNGRVEDWADAITCRTAKTVTLLELVQAGASLVQREKFKMLFGESIDLTLDLCVANASEFDFEWAGKHLLSNTRKETFEAAMVSHQMVYHTEVSPLYADYVAAMDPHCPAYFDDESLFHAIWHALVVPYIVKAYDNATTSFRTAYQVAAATEFFNLYKRSNENA